MSRAAVDCVALAERAWLWLDIDRDWTNGSTRDLQQEYFDLLANDVVLDVDSPEDDVVYGTEIRGKQAVIEMYRQAPDWIEGNCLERPLEFVGSGDRVVVLGAERYTLKKTGVTARNKEFAIVMDFCDGLITRIRQIGDQSEWVEAYRSSNIIKARKAFRALEANSDGDGKYSDLQPYIDLLADEVVLTVAGPEHSALSGEFRGKEEVVNLITMTIPELVKEIQVDEPMEFFGSEDRVVLLGSESYTIRQTGVVVNSKAFVVVMDFQDGEVVRMLQLKDMAELADAFRNN